MQRWGRPFALGVGLGWAVVVLVFWTTVRGAPVDAWCYYGIDPARPYDPSGCFLYSPVVAQLMIAIRDTVPFDVFFTALRTIEMVVLALVTGPALGPALFIPAVAIEINAANVNLLIVAAVLLGFRYPWTWAFIILTKVTPGIGLLWFAVRREWKHLAIALGVTLALAAVSFAIAPWMWPAYIEALRTAPDETPIGILWRLPIAALLVIWGARTNRRWTLLVAVVLALPRLYILSPVLLVGLFPLVRLPRPLPIIGRWSLARSADSHPAAQVHKADPLAE